MNEYNCEIPGLGTHPTCIARWTGATTEAAWQIDALIVAGIHFRSTFVDVTAAGTGTCHTHIGIRPRPALVTDAHISCIIAGGQTGAVAAAQLRRLIGQAGVVL